MSDDFDFVPPPPKAAEQSIQDDFDYLPAYRFSFVGVGQAGGRIANAFKSLGYQRVCAANTASADMAELPFSDTAKLLVGDAQGAGKDPEAAAKAFASADEDIFDMLTRSWGPETDYGFVCLSGAGGTGAGAFPKVAEVVKKFMRSHGKPNRVGCVMALPKNADGQRSAQNALRSVNALRSLNLSPILFIDNERFSSLYGHHVSAKDEKPQSNAATAKLLHAFNRLSGTASEDAGGTTFDPTDFSKVLGSGVTALAAAAVSQWSSPADITEPVREQLRQNVLAEVDLAAGSVAGLLYIVSGEAWDGSNPVKGRDLDYGAEMMNRMLSRQDSAVFQGVYPQPAGEPGIRLLAMIGGLPWPTTRLQALRELAGNHAATDEVAKHLGLS